MHRLLALPEGHALLGAATSADDALPALPAIATDEGDVLKLVNCSVCGKQFRNDLGHYKCVQPGERLDQTADFQCPGVACAHHEVL